MSPVQQLMHIVSVAVWWTALLALATFIPLGHGKKGEEEGRCGHKAVAVAMTTCQGQRHKLSLASQANDTGKLCGALQQYSACMTPRIEGCKGPAKMAFDVITGKYEAQPYNCRIDYRGDSISADTKEVGDEPYHGPSSLGDRHFEEAVDEDVPEDHHHHDHAAEQDNSIGEQKKEATEDVRGVFSQHPISRPGPAEDDAPQFPDSPSSSAEADPAIPPSPSTTSSTERYDENKKERKKTPSVAATTHSSADFDPSGRDNGAENVIHKSSLLTQLIASISLYVLLHLLMST